MKQESKDLFECVIVGGVLGAIILAMAGGGAKIITLLVLWGI